MNEVKKEDAATLDPQLRRRRRGIRVVQSAIVAIIAGLRGTAVLGLEHPATLSTSYLELVQGINGADNLREGIRIRASSTTLSSNNLASFYYSRVRYFETSGISWVLALCKKVLDQIFVVLASF